VSRSYRWLRGDFGRGLAQSTQTGTGHTAVAADDYYHTIMVEFSREFGYYY